ncbi:hypothetical protein QUS22_02380 [Wolbachia pipientis]|nr:hypothetical protein [Wolbachia pipientis]
MGPYYGDIEGLIKEPYLFRGRDYFNKGKVQIISVNESQLMNLNANQK